MVYRFVAVIQYKRFYFLEPYMFMHDFFYLVLLNDQKKEVNDLCIQHYEYQNSAENKSDADNIRYYT